MKKRLTDLRSSAGGAAVGGKMGLGEKNTQTADKQPFCGRLHKQRWRATELETRLSFCWLKCVTQTLRQFRVISVGFRGGGPHRPVCRDSPLPLFPGNPV